MIIDGRATSTDMDAWLVMSQSACASVPEDSVNGLVGIKVSSAGYCCSSEEEQQ